MEYHDMLIKPQHKAFAAFLILVLIYFVLFAGISATIYNQECAFSACEKAAVTVSDDEKSMVTNALIDQLKGNRSGYSNNVWKTLATLMLAIGMALGSNKFQAILKSGNGAVPVFQFVLVALYALHACAYILYQNFNTNLMYQLVNISNKATLYRGYRISDAEVIFNLFFDTVLFVLLVYIVGHIKDVQSEKK